MNSFNAFDFNTFWEKSDYADGEYVDEPFTAPVLAGVEAELGFKLPVAYVLLATHQNGGVPRRTVHGVSTPTTWSHDHVALTGDLFHRASEAQFIVRRVRQSILD